MTVAAYDLEFDCARAGFAPDAAGLRDAEERSTASSVYMRVTRKSANSEKEGGEVLAPSFLPFLERFRIEFTGRHKNSKRIPMLH